MDGARRYHIVLYAAAWLSMHILLKFFLPLPVWLHVVPGYYSSNMHCMEGHTFDVYLPLGWGLQAPHTGRIPMRCMVVLLGFGVPLIRWQMWFGLVWLELSHHCGNMRLRQREVKQHCSRIDV